MYYSRCVHTPPPSLLLLVVTSRTLARTVQLFFSWKVSPCTAAAVCILLVIEPIILWRHRLVVFAKGLLLPRPPSIEPELRRIKSLELGVFGPPLHERGVAE